ncbi:MAG: BamA/TamA family outer membrane protein [Blastocatellia bacterium]|nr:BamA/TamA family outer membrane protein [Blastocatellia bacterium]
MIRQSGNWVIGRNRANKQSSTPAPLPPCPPASCAPAPLLLCLLLAAFCLLLSVDARANDLSDFIGKRVVRVEVIVEGAPDLSTIEMQEQITVEAGQDYSPVRIHESLVRLHNAGLISGARVEGEASGPEGVVLKFLVRPQPRIENVLFEGDDNVPASELRARLNDLDTGQKLSTSAVWRGLGELQAYYSARGFYQASITPDIKLDPSGTRATVVYAINPGAQARLSSYNLGINGARIDLSEIEHALVEGEPFAQMDVQTEMDRLKEAYLKQDYLAVDVSTAIEPDPAGNRVAVTITLNSGPVVEVAVAGIEISEKKKREILPFYTRGSLDEFTLEDGRRRLEEYAQQQGYFFVEVNRPSPPDRSLPSVRLDYMVTTGRRYRLTDIDIEGLDAIPSKELQDQMQSKEASFIPFFGLNRGKTSDDILRQDTNLVLKRLRDLGYRRAQVDVLRGVSIDSERLLITFDIRQGPRTYIEEIGVRGNNVMAEDQLRERLEIEAGDPLVTSEVTGNADRLLAAYNREGYADAEVITELADLGNYDGQERVRLIYSINEGNRVRVLNVITRGTGLTDNGRLERDFYLFKKGDWLRADEMQETERVLYDTDAFSTVTISSRTVTQTAGGIEERDVSVDLVEAKRWLLIYGFGYQTSESMLKVPGLEFLNGARALIQLTNTNLLGKLYTGSTQLRVSQNELFGQVSFQNPRPFGIKWPALISFFGRRLAEETFRSDRYTMLLQVERRLSPDSLLYLSYNFERISIFDLQGSPEDIARNQMPIRLGRIGPSFARDTRDRASEPAEGTLTLGSLSLASTVFGGNEQFLKLLVEHNRYYRIKRFRDTVYSVSGRLGLGTPFGGRQTLPISERFFAGGARDLRGLDFEQAGPRDPAPVFNADGTPQLDENGDPVTALRPVGGNAVFIINNELRFPIYEILGGAVFSDTGNVFRRVRDFRPQDLTQTIGLGLRLATPVGPIRVDFGYLVFNKPEGLPRSQIHVSFGSTF